MSEPTTIEKVLERPHHPYSPSSLQSLEACPCYRSRQEKVQHERTTAGTKAHGVAESGVDDASLSDDDAAAAADCLDFIEQRRALMEDSRNSMIRERVSAGMNSTEGANLVVPEIIELKEEYLPVDDLIFPDTKHTTAGYIDHALICHDTYAEVFDWKFGRWFVVAAKDNLQGIAYSLGIFKKFPKVNTVRFFFKMAILDHVSEAVFTRAQIPELYLRVQTVVARARAARSDADFKAANATVPNCNFCANLGRCPAVAAFMIAVARKFYPLSVPDDITPSALHTARDTTAGLQLASVAGCWAKAYRTQVTDRIIRGEADIPAGHVIQTKADREVADPEKYKAVALTRLTPEQYAASCNVVFGKVETCIKDAAPRGAKKAAIEAFNEELLASGAVVKGQPYSFLKAISTKDE